MRRHPDTIRAQRALPNAPLRLGRNRSFFLLLAAAMLALPAALRAQSLPLIGNGNTLAINSNQSGAIYNAALNFDSSVSILENGQVLGNGCAALDQFSSTGIDTGAVFVDGANNNVYLAIVSGGSLYVIYETVDPVAGNCTPGPAVVQITSVFGAPANAEVEINGDLATGNIYVLLGYNGGLEDDFTIVPVAPWGSAMPATTSLPLDYSGRYGPLVLDSSNDFLYIDDLTPSSSGSGFWVYDPANSATPANNLVHVVGYMSGSATVPFSAPWLFTNNAGLVALVNQNPTSGNVTVPVTVLNTAQFSFFGGTQAVATGGVDINPGSGGLVNLTAASQYALVGAAAVDTTDNAVDLYGYQSTAGYPGLLLAYNLTGGTTPETVLDNSVPGISGYSGSTGPWSELDYDPYFNGLVFNGSVASSGFVEITSPICQGLPVSLTWLQDPGAFGTLPAYGPFSVNAATGYAYGAIPDGLIGVVSPPSDGCPATQVSVPNVSGDSQSAAGAAITSIGLVVGTVTTASSSTVPAGDVISQSPVAGTEVNPGSAVSLVISSGPAQIAVPNVVGDTQSAAGAAFTSIGLVVGTITTASSSTVPAGDVISQSPAAGTLVNPGSAVNLVISSGPSLIVVPDVVGDMQATAEQAIAGAGLTVGSVTFTGSNSVPAGEVLSQSPAAGTQASAGTAVNLTISSGPGINETITTSDDVFVAALLSEAAGPFAAYSYSSLGFASQTTQVLTLANSGQQPLTISAVTLAGANFSSTAACSTGSSTAVTTLPPGGACNLTITYTPPASGTGNGTLTFTDNAAVSNLPSTSAGAGAYTQSVALSGASATNGSIVPVLFAIVVSPASAIGAAGATTQQFTATGYYSDGTSANLTQSVTWASSETSVATISNAAGTQGLATFVSGGTTTITATLGSVSGSATLTVPIAINETITTTDQVAITTSPLIISATHATFTVGTFGTFTAASTGLPAPTLSESGTLPPHITFNPATGTLSGIPERGTAGTYPLTLTASNGTAPNAMQSFTLTVLGMAPKVSLIGAPASAPYNAVFPVLAETDDGVIPEIAGAAGVCSVETVFEFPGVTIALVHMLTGTGVCTVTATWQGNTTYAPATLTQSVQARKADSATTLDNVPANSFAGSAVATAVIIHDQFADYSPFDTVTGEDFSQWAQTYPLYLEAPATPGNNYGAFVTFQVYAQAAFGVPTGSLSAGSTSQCGLTAVLPVIPFEAICSDAPVLVPQHLMYRAQSCPAQSECTGRPLIERTRRLYSP